MSYYVSGYYQEKAILKKEGQLFFLKCEEADAPTGTMVQGLSLIHISVPLWKNDAGAGRTKRGSPQERGSPGGSD